MSETLLAITRHGSPEDDHGPGNIYSPKAPLSELGHQQADRLAQILQEEHIEFDVIYSTPLPRGYQTAEPLPLKKSGQLHIVESFAEPDLGGHIGRAFSDIPRSADGTLLDFYAEDLGQTPFAHTAIEVKDALSEVINQIKPGQNIGIVTHGIIGKLIMHFLRNPDAELPLCESDLRTRDQLGNAETNLVTLSVDNQPTNERRLNAKHMDVIKVKEYLHMSYPQANIIEATQIDGVTTETIAELGVSKNGEKSDAIAVIRRSRPHHHNRTTETYKVLHGTLHVVVDGKEITKRKGEKLKIKPGQVHFAYGDDVWVDVVSQPPYSPDDVFED